MLFIIQNGTTTAVVQDIPWVLVNFMSGRDKICFSSASQFKKKNEKANPDPNGRETQYKMETIRLDLVFIFIYKRHQFT